MNMVEYEQALAIARSLQPRDQARLISQLAEDLVAEPSTPSQRSREAWARLAELREEFRKLGPGSPSAGEQLELDRQSRADFLEGKIRDIYVHP